MKFTVTALLLALAGCVKPPGAVTPAHAEEDSPVTLTAHAAAPDVLCENKPYSDDDLQTAAIDVLYSQLLHPNRYGSVEAVGRARERLAEVRKWTATITNAKIRAAYVNWLDFYAKDYDDVESEITKGARKDLQEAEEDRERKEEQARANALSKCLPVPEPPK